MDTLGAAAVGVEGVPTGVMVECYWKKGKARALAAAQVLVDWSICQRLLGILDMVVVVASMLVARCICGLLECPVEAEQLLVEAGAGVGVWQYKGCSKLKGRACGRPADRVSARCPEETLARGPVLPCVRLAPLRRA